MASANCLMNAWPNGPPRKATTSEGDDLSWARAHVDQARADGADGRVLTVQEHEARMDALLTSLKGSWRGS